MKTSNKILLGAFVGILVMCIAILVTIRLALNDPRDEKSRSVKKSSIGLKEITITDCNSVDLKGNWKASIVRSEIAYIRVKGPLDLLTELSVNRYGNSIELHMPKKRNSERKLRLEMTLPLIQSIRTRGVADISISGFDLEELTIDAEGVSSIRGKEGRIQQLNFRGKGVSKLDLENIPARNADLSCEGVVNIDLTMAGGKLSGAIKGVGNVRYKGTTSHESIHVKGACKVSQL